MTLLFLTSDANHWTRKRPEKRACPTKPITFHSSGVGGSGVTANHLVAETAFLHPAYRQKIDEGPEDPVPDPVLARAARARAMVHGDLRHREALDAKQRGQEPVHAGVELEPRERF